MPSKTAILQNIFPSEGIWSQNAGAFNGAPVLRAMNDPSFAFYFMDDFTDLPTGKYTATQATAGTFALDDASGGVALADCNSTTVTQGINVQLGGSTGECFLPAAGKTIWFEARFKATDIATGPEFYLGLAAIDTTIIAASANSSTDHIGWQSVTDDGVLLFTSEKGGTGATKASHTLVENTTVTLGFRVNGVTSIEHYINGSRQSTTQVTANIPILEMLPSLVCQSDGATDSIVHLDYWRCLQTR